jgi:hypothetical protein
MNVILKDQLIRGHTLNTLAYRGTYLVRKIGQNANLVNRAYLVNMLTRLLSWSKLVKNVLTQLKYVP